MFNYVKFPEKSIDSFSFYIICHYYSAATLREEFLNHKNFSFSSYTNNMTKYEVS